MGLNYSPKIITNGLLFNYNVKDTINSYLGEPTTNLINPINIGIYSSWVRSIQSLVLLTEKYNGQPIYRLSLSIDDTTQLSYAHTLNGVGTGWYISDNITYTLNLPYIASVIYRPVSHPDIQVTGLPSNIPGWGANYNDSITIDNYWKRFRVDRNYSSTQSDYKYYHLYVPSAQLNDVLVVDITCNQIEQKSHLTPFVYGTRSSTQGLLPTFKSKLLSSVGVDVNFTHTSTEVDNIESTIHITRGGNSPIYNSYYEDDYSSGVSPSHTEWNRYGWNDLTDVSYRTYVSFDQLWSGANIENYIVDDELVMHSLDSDKYYRIKFKSWTKDGSEFSYTRNLITLPCNVVKTNAILDLSNMSFDSNSMLTFDGVTNRIKTDFRLHYGSNFTISAMIYSKGDASTYNTIIGDYSIWLSVLYGNSIGLYSTIYGFVCKTATNSILSNKWYYITCTIEYGSTNIVNIYINDTLSATGSYTGIDVAANFKIGDCGSSSTGNGCFYGYIDNVLIYNKVLSLSEIKYNYNNIKTIYSLT
jgi:hypothetical protein